MVWVGLSGRSWTNCLNFVTIRSTAQDLFRYDRVDRLTLHSGGSQHRPTTNILLEILDFKYSWIDPNSLWWNRASINPFSAMDQYRKFEWIIWVMVAHNKGHAIRNMCRFLKPQHSALREQPVARQFRAYEDSTVSTAWILKSSLCQEEGQPCSAQLFKLHLSRMVKCISVLAALLTFLMDIIAGLVWDMLAWF